MNSNIMQSDAPGKVRLLLLLVLLIVSATIVGLYFGTSLFNDNGGWGSLSSAAAEPTEGVDAAGPRYVPADLAATLPAAGQWPVPGDERFQVELPLPPMATTDPVVASAGSLGEGVARLFVPPLYTRSGTAAMRDALLEAPGGEVVWAGGDQYFRRNLAERWPDVLPADLYERWSLKPARPGEVVVRLVPAVAGARVWLDDSGDLVTNRYGIVRIDGVSAGEGRLTVQAARYEPVIEQVEVMASGTDQTIELDPILGRLEVLTSPGASLVATDEDGQVYQLGTAGNDGWIRVNDVLQIGSYTVTLTAPSREGAEEQVELPVGRIIRWFQPLSPYPGQLRVVTVPVDARADILLPGGEFRPMGETPVTIEEVPAEVDVGVAVVQLGYLREMRQVRLEAAETRVLNFGTLTAGAGDLEFVVENEGFDADRADVVVDGENGWPRRSDNTLLVEGLAAGLRDVSIIHPEYQPFAEAVDVVDQRQVSHSIYLTPLPAELTLTVLGPAREDWRLAVDGIPQSPVETTPDSGQSRRYSLPAEEDLELSVSAPGWLTRERSARFSRGERRALEVELEPEEKPREQQFSVVELPDGQRMEFARVPEGEFFLGSESTENGRFPDEGPRTRIIISRPFWIGKTPVTQAQWRAVMGTSLGTLRDRGNPNWPLHGEGPAHPIYYVSWDEAMAFCRTLTELERRAGRLPDGYYFTLPTEAQWEYAARAGSDSRWSFGDSEGDLDRYSWYIGNSGGITHPVGQKLPNAWGLYDVHGNIWEWTRSWYGPYPGGTEVDYQGVPSGTTRVHRSSSWNAAANKTRSAYRDWLEPSDRGYDLGFRVIIESTLQQDLRPLWGEEGVSQWMDPRDSGARRGDRDFRDRQEYLRDGSSETSTADPRPPPAVD